MSEPARQNDGQSPEGNATAWPFWLMLVASAAYLALCFAGVVAPGHH